MMTAKSGLLAILTCLGGADLAPAQDAREKPDPIPTSLALKLGSENLTEYTGLSEAGQDRAAQIHAAARRIQTEHSLGDKDLKLVLALDEWRESLTNCRRGFFTFMYMIEGGGTMYGHAQARDCNEVEDFLADLSKRLPLEGKGKGDAKAIRQIDDTLAFLKALKPYDTGDPNSMKETKTQFAAKIEETNRHFEVLKGMLSEIPADQARKIAAFSVEPVSWLKEDNNH